MVWRTGPSPGGCGRLGVRRVNAAAPTVQVHELIELIHTRRSEKDGHAMDVLMEALRKQRVQAHIAGELQRALARAKELKRGTVSVLSPEMWCHAVFPLLCACFHCYVHQV